MDAAAAAARDPTVAVCVAVSLTYNGTSAVRRIQSIRIAVCAAMRPLVAAVQAWARDARGKKNAAGSERRRIRNRDPSAFSNKPETRAAAVASNSSTSEQRTCTTRGANDIVTGAAGSFKHQARAHARDETKDVAERRRNSAY